MGAQPFDPKELPTPQNPARRPLDQPTQPPPLDPSQLQNPRNHPTQPAKKF